MPLLNPFWRAAAIALAWCLVGLGFDPGPDAADAPPAANAQRVAWVPGEFANERPQKNISIPKLNNPR
jgi:hypothetical protein